MWHAARAQERKLRGTMIDYRKRAERRRAYQRRLVRLAFTVCDFPQPTGQEVKQYGKGGKNTKKSNGKEN